LNLEIAAKLGMQTIEMQNVEQLKKTWKSWAWVCEILSMAASRLSTAF